VNSQPIGASAASNGISGQPKITGRSHDAGAGPTRAAVALILRECNGDREVLFIERARDERDPWSGHLAFPGGKLEPGEQEQQTAERETQEEIGLDLRPAQYLGRLPDIVGTNLPVRVSCFVYLLADGSSNMDVNAEVQDIFWVRMAELRNSHRHVTSTVRFSENSMEVPAIILPQSGKPVLWGITYRLVMHYLEGLLQSSSIDTK
jgi:mutator protein MutT